MFGLFKPKWEHANPDIRRQAITTLTDNDILITIAKEDENIDVRKTAASQLTDIPFLLELHRKNEFANVTDNKLQELIREHAADLKFTPELGNYLATLDNSSLLQHLSAHNNDEQLTMSLLNKQSDPVLLLQACTDAASSESRGKAAQLLNDDIDEASLRTAIKNIGKRDKKTTQILREKLLAIKLKQEQTGTLEVLTNQLGDLGNTENWKADQARLELLEKRWNELAHVATASHNSHWDQACSATKTRINEQKTEANAVLPVIESKQLLIELAEKFSVSLKDKLYLPTADEDELVQTLNSFTAEWNDLPLLEPAKEQELAVPYNGFIEQSRNRIEELRKNARASKVFEKLLDKITSILKKKVIPENSVENLQQEWSKKSPPKDTTLADKLQSDFNQRLDKLRTRITKQQIKREDGLKRIDEWLKTLQSDLADDKISSAGNLYSKIESLIDDLPALPTARKRSINDILLDCRPKLKHLEGWRHWGTDKAREALIDEATTLINTEQPPQERLKNLKNLRERWKKLGKIDPQSARALWERFDTACNKAFEPVSKNREKENEQRKQHMEARQTLCEKLELIHKETDWSAPEWREIDKQITQLRNQWRQAGPVKHTKWKGINKRFNDAVAALDEYLEDERRISINRRTRLIEQLEAIKDDEDLNQVLQTTKDLQKQWQPTVLSRRSEEQKLWNQFRATADYIFARSKERRDEDNREMDELLRAKSDVCKQLEDIAKLKGDELAQAHGQSVKLESQWDELGDSRNRRYNKIEQRYRKAVTNIKNAFENQLINEKRSRLELLLKGKCEQTAENVDNELLQTLLLEIEILMEIDSPEELANERMRLQVERLADNMGSSNQDSVIDEVITLAKKVCMQLQAGASIDKLDARINNLLKNSSQLQ